MIEFEWRHHNTYEYHITWKINEERYQVLYLHYRNVSPIVRIDRDKVISLSVEEETGVIQIYPTNGYHFEAIPKLPPAEYIFELKETSDPHGETVQDCCYKLLNAPSINVIKKEVGYKDEFSKLLVQSAYKIPDMYMEFYFPTMKNGYSMPVPEMKRSSDSIYISSCIIKSGESKNIEVKFNEKINRFIHYTEEK